MSIIAARAKGIPSIKPGKNPATTAAAGNFEQWLDVSDSQVGLVDEAAPVAVEVALEVADDLVEEEAIVEEFEAVLLLSVQPPLEQV